MPLFDINFYGMNVFTLLVGVLIVLGIGQLVVRSYILRGDFMTALETLKRTYGNQDEGRKEAVAKLALLKKQVNRHPLIILINTAHNLILLGFLGYIFHVWMNTVALDMLATDLGQLWYKAQLGFLGLTAGLIILRALAGLSHANTGTAGPVSVTPDTNWLSAVADPSSGWAKLEHILVALAFVTVVTSAFAAVGRIITITQ